MMLNEYTDDKINSTEGQILEPNATILGNLTAHDSTYQYWTKNVASMDIK